MHQLFEKNEKYKQFQPTNQDPDEYEKINKQKLQKESVNLENLRTKFDQNKDEISIVDDLLYNQFTMLELCKLRIDFLSILYTKKSLMYQNFDEHTIVEIQRFES